MKNIIWHRVLLAMVGPEAGTHQGGKRTTMSMVMKMSLKQPNMYSSSPNTCRPTTVSAQPDHQCQLRDNPKS
jgi:hypothetical protein